MPGRKLTLSRVIGPLILTLSIIGFLAAFTITVEKIALLKNPAHETLCDISPLISCGSVMKTPQSGVFGFPNSLIGIAGFGIMMAIGLSILAGAQFKRWFWLVVQGGVTFGMAFVFWLQYQSIYNIGALCPFCMVVWFIMIPLFWYVTLYNLREDNLKFKYDEFLQKHHGDILIVWYLALAGVILNHFWYYWSTLL